MKGSERTTVGVLQLLVNVRTCLLIRGIPDLFVPALWKVAMADDVTGGINTASRYSQGRTHHGTDGQLITPAAYRLDERRRRQEELNVCSMLVYLDGLELGVLPVAALTGRSVSPPRMGNGY